MAFWVELGESTSLLCDPGYNQTLALSAMNFSDPALGTSPGDKPCPPGGTGTFPQSSGKAQAAAPALPLQQGCGSQSYIFLRKMFHSEPSVLLKQGTWDMKCLLLLNAHSVITCSLPAPREHVSGGVQWLRTAHPQTAKLSPPHPSGYQRHSGRLNFFLCSTGNE